MTNIVSNKLSAHGCGLTGECILTGTSRKLVTLLFCFLTTIVTFGQGKVVRQQQTQASKKSTTAKAATMPKSKVNVAPQKMEKGIYYMCVAWGKNINWVKGVSKTWAAKGYKPNLVTLPKDLDGYYVCIKQFCDKSSAERFAKSFNKYDLGYI